MSLVKEANAFDVCEVLGVFPGVPGVLGEETAVGSLIGHLSQTSPHGNISSGKKIMSKINFEPRNKIK